MKKVGQILELDPTKKYLFIFDKTQVDTETIVGFMDAVMNKPGAIALALPSLDNFMIVENSEHVADVIGKGDFKIIKEKINDDENIRSYPNSRPEVS